MTNFTVLYDSCVLYPFILRNLLMELALCDLFRAKWSNRIHEEWITNLLEKRSDLTREQLNRTRDLMNAHVLDSVVENFEDIEPSLNLPDPGDNHVLAAAIVSSSDVIVTYNLKDFPANELSKYGIEAQHPDVFLMHLADLDEIKFLEAVKQSRLRLRKPPKSQTEYLDIIESRDLKDTAKLNGYGTSSVPQSKSMVERVGHYGNFWSIYLQFLLICFQLLTLIFNPSNNLTVVLNNFKILALINWL